MQLKCKFDNGEFALLAELQPPKGTDISRMMANIQTVRDKIDAFVVTDMCNAVLHMSALSSAMLLQSNGVETVMQVCVRDRNRLALQADLLGANACGIVNLLAVSGEDPTFGDHQQAVAVHDLDHLDLLYAICGLQKGKDLAGRDLDGCPRFLIGSTVNSNLRGQALELEIEKMNRRYEAGACFFVTPPVFDPESMGPFFERIDPRKYKIVPSVLMLKSLGMVRYIARNLKHVAIPPKLIKRIQSARDKGQECLRITLELITALKASGFCGAQITTLGGEDRLAALLSVSEHAEERVVAYRSEADHHQ